MSPFEKANRRIIRRLGSPIRMVTASGVTIDDKLGVFKTPENEGLVKGSGGRLEFKAQKTTLLMMAADVAGISKEWRFFVGSSEYYAAKWFEDGTGTILITLGTPSDQEGDENGGGWR